MNGQSPGGGVEGRGIGERGSLLVDHTMIFNSLFATECTHAPTMQHLPTPHSSGAGSIQHVPRIRRVIISKETSVIALSFSKMVQL